MKTYRLLLGAAALLAAFPAVAQTAGKPALVASFPDEVTGVAVSETGRTFVNFPRWTSDVAISVAEVAKDGTIRAYPDAGWNQWRNSNKAQVDPTNHFVSVQSVVADRRGALWVVDPGAPNAEKVVPGAAKLVKIDLATNQVVQVIHFGEDVAPAASYMNDVRFSPDGKFAFLTDSGARGAIVVVDLASGSAKRVLDGHPSTQLEKDVVVTVGGKPLRRPDGRQPEFAADGIAVSPDGFVYYQATTGKTLYRVPVAILTDPGATAFAIEQAVERLGENRVPDGLWYSKAGTLYLTGPETSEVKMRAPDGTIRTFVKDARLNWPDSMAEGPDGSLYVTASHIPDNAWFKPANGPRLKTELYRIPVR